MIVLRQTLGLYSIIYIFSSLLLECKATLDSEKIFTKNVQDDHDIFYLKPSRKMLGVGDSEIFQMNSSSYENSKHLFWLCLIIMLVIFLFLLKCCIRLANAQDNETARVMVHPPPRIQPQSRSSTSSRSASRSHISSRSATRSHTSSRSPARSYTSSRSFASPQTRSRSLILLPEPGIDQTVYLAIENPNFNLYAINLNTSDQINHQQSNALPSNLPPRNPPSSNPPTQLQDLPPDYESVVATNQQNDNRLSHAVSIRNDFQSSEKMLPPKYEDLQS